MDDARRPRPYPTETKLQACIPLNFLLTTIITLCSMHLHTASGARTSVRPFATMTSAWGLVQAKTERLAARVIFRQLLTLLIERSNTSPYACFPGGPPCAMRRFTRRPTRRLSLNEASEEFINSIQFRAFPAPTCIWSSSPSIGPIFICSTYTSSVLYLI